MDYRAGNTLGAWYGKPGQRKGWRCATIISAAATIAALPLQSSAAYCNAGGSDVDILFAGDSDIEGWDTTCCHFPNSKNVGVGGDRCSDVLKTIDAQLAAHTPEWVVLVCGENNFPGDSVETAFQQYSQLVTKINAAGAKVLYMGTKPEPGTVDLHTTYDEYDAKVFALAATNSKLHVKDVHAEFETLGNPGTLYQEDRLHMAASGYALWSAWAKEAMGLTDTGACGSSGPVVSDDDDDDDDAYDDDDDDGDGAPGAGRRVRPPGADNGDDAATTIVAALGAVAMAAAGLLA